MRKFRTNMMLVIVLLMNSFPVTTQASTPSEDNVPKVGDVSDSGCTDRTRADSSRGLVLTKEGDIVTCQINGFVANCGVDYFDVSSDYKKGNDAPDSLFLNLCPVVPSEKDCTCPYNVSFTIRNIKADHFYIYCWPYIGIVSFKETNQVILDFNSDQVTIDNFQYYLYKPGLHAKISKMTNLKGEVRIPATIIHEGQNYTVSSINPEGIGGTEMTKLIIPNTIRNMGNAEFRNLLNAYNRNLEAIEVETGCPLISSVDGVLYSGDCKTLYCLPAGKSLTDYTVIDGVESIGSSAFSYCPTLKTIRFPESLTTIRAYAFAESPNLESIIIPGKLDHDLLGRAFLYMTSSPTLYVVNSEMDFFKSFYKGPVLPLSSLGDTQGISNTNLSSGVPADSYDLQGRRLIGKPGKGVYIQNGEKRVVR